MTPEEKAKEIESLYRKHVFDLHQVQILEDVKLTFLLAQAIREAGPREVSDLEIAALYFEYCSKPRVDLHSETFEAAFKIAMRLNAMAKLESSWPSNEEGWIRIQEAGSAEQRGFLKACSWLKARVLGSNK